MRVCVHKIMFDSVKVICDVVTFWGHSVCTYCNNTSENLCRRRVLLHACIREVGSRNVDSYEQRDSSTYFVSAARQLML